MSFLSKIFRRKPKQDPQPLRVDGIAGAPMTAEPDDAELAAQALLEMMAGAKSATARDQAVKQGNPEKGTEEYYRRLSERIRLAHAAAALRTKRFVAFCEQELNKKDLPKEGPGSLALLEAELYKRIDTIEREGGDLKKRWQHCLAEVTVRLMEIVNKQDYGTDN